VLLAQRKDLAQGAVLRTWLDDSVIPTFRERMLPIDLSVAIRAASCTCPTRRRFEMHSSGRRPSCTD
jgi:hypothetical protein